VTSSQVQIEPLNGHLQIDGDMVKAHAEVVGQLAEEPQVQISGQAPEIPLGLKPSKSLARTKFAAFLPLCSGRSPGPGPNHVTTILSPFSPLPTSISPTRRKEMPLTVLCPYRSRDASGRGSSRYRRRYRACRRWGQEWRCEGGPEEASKKQKSEPADATPRTKRAKEPSRKKKEARVEETTKVTCIDEPIREKMFVTTDAKGNLKNSG